MHIPENHPRALARDTSHYVECRGSGRILVVEILGGKLGATAKAAAAFVRRFGFAPEECAFI